MRFTSSFVSAVLFATLGSSLHAQTTIEPAKPVRPTTQAGKLNAITDVPGIEVGNFEQRFTGTTVVLAPKGAVGGVDVREVIGEEYRRLSTPRPDIPRELVRGSQ